jgi:nucleoside-diphosphate-sugar epimerase
MRVFVTGATGFVGTAVVQELIATGHQVLGLTRSDAGAKSLLAAGAQVHRGDLEDLDSLRRGAAAADGVIHTAFNHDFSKFKANCETDRQVIETLGAALAGTDRPLVVTSAIGILPPGRLSTEQAVPGTGAAGHPRSASEEAADTVAARGVRVSVVRLAASVHGVGDHAFVPLLIGLARQKGISAHVGDGLNRWPAVHRLDAAHLYRLVLENGSAGARYHGVAEQGITLRNIANVIGRHLNVPVVAMSDDEAANHFGWFVHFAAMDMPASSEQTQERLGWQPKQPGLIADLDGANYFTN